MRRRLTFLILALLSIYTLSITFSALLAVRTTYPYIGMEEGWEMEMRGETYTGVRLSALEETGIPEIREGDIISLKHVLPDMEAVPFPTLGIKLRYCAYEAFLDGALVDSARMEDLARGQFIGSGQFFVRLPRGAEGRELTLKLYITKDKPFHYITTPYYGNYDDVSHMFFHQQLFPLISGIYLFIFGLLFLIIALFFIARVPEMQVTMVSALLCIALAIWSLCRYDLIGLFFHMRDKTLLEYMSFYTIPLIIVSIIWVTGNYASGRRFFILTLPLMMAAAFNVGGAVLGIFPINRYRNIFLAAMAIAALAVFAETVFCFKQKLETVGQIQMVSVTVLNILLCIEVVVYALEQRNPVVQEHLSGIALPAGGLLYSLGQIMNFFVFITRSYVRREEAASLRRMAYEDILTGLPNRASYDRETKRLDEEGCSYCMISLDLNDLKETNDTLGHAFGDALLEDFGHTLRTVFGGIGFCARTGGDEFVVILRAMHKGRDEERIRNRLQELEDRLRAQDKPGDKIRHSVSYGYAFSDEREGMHSHEVFLLADSRMYDLKRIQHNLTHNDGKEEENNEEETV